MRSDDNNISSTLRALSYGPSVHVIKYSGYVINGIHFDIEERDNNRTTQNSGVSIIAKTMQFSSAKDKNPIYCDVVYYGVVKEVWELDYTSFRIPLFLCEWVDINNGVRVDKNGFTLVNFNRLVHKEEPFIMASQAKQVFYVRNSCNYHWCHVFPTQPKDYGGYEQADDDTIVELLTPIKGLTEPLIVDDKFEEEHDYVRHDGEGIWIENKT